MFATMTSHTSPWDWMQPHDVARMGAVIADPAEQQRWCRAVMLGGLPYMWCVMAKGVREMLWDKLELRANDKVLIVGESVESCRFVDDIRARVGPGGEIRVIDITEEARDAYFQGRRGRHGALATWTWDYTSDVPDETYDHVAVLQAIQHADDWGIVAHSMEAELMQRLSPELYVGGTYRFHTQTGASFFTPLAPPGATLRVADSDLAPLDSETVGGKIVVDYPLVGEFRTLHLELACERYARTNDLRVNIVSWATGFRF